MFYYSQSVTSLEKVISLLVNSADKKKARDEKAKVKGYSYNYNIMIKDIEIFDAFDKISNAY